MSPHPGLSREHRRKERPCHPLTLQCVQLSMALRKHVEVRGVWLGFSRALRSGVGIFTFYKGSAWVSATHAPGRAGQHFDLFGSIFDLSKNRYHTTHSLRV